MKMARKIMNYRGRRSLIGKFASYKMGQKIMWESTIERDFIYLLEVDLSVNKYFPQPFKIEYWKEGKKHSYTPDFIVERGSKSQVMEVKPTSKVLKYKDLFREVDQVCKKEGREFKVVTDQVIRVEPRLSNAKILCRYSWDEVSFDFIKICEELFSKHETLTLGELKNHYSSLKLPHNQIFTLMYLGKLSFDIDKPFDNNLLLRSDNKWEAPLK